MDRNDYLKDENWYGSYYELAMEFYPGGNDARLLKAIEALWQSEFLTGPWSTRENFIATAEMPTTLEEEGANRLYGLIELPGQELIGCLSMTVREEKGSDWLDFCIPTGMLGFIFTVHYPLFEGFTLGSGSVKSDNRGVNPWIDNVAWMDRVDKAFVQIAEMVYKASPFDVAIYGEEVSGYTSTSYASIETATPEQLMQGGYVVPPHTFSKLRSSIEGVTLTSGLLWVPYKRPFDK